MPNIQVESRTNNAPWRHWTTFTSVQAATTYVIGRGIRVGARQFRVVDGHGTVVYPPPDPSRHPSCPAECSVTEGQRPHTVSERPSSTGGRFVCGAHVFVWCDLCGGWTFNPSSEREYALMIRGVFVCDPEIHDYTSCAVCTTWVRDEDTDWCESCEAGYCRTCYEAGEHGEPSEHDDDNDDDGDDECGDNDDDEYCVMSPLPSTVCIECPSGYRIHLDLLHGRKLCIHELTAAQLRGVPVMHADALRVAASKRTPLRVPESM